MAEHDDELSRRYRAAARDAPPPALDAAILAASRRAVGARPGGVRRWAGPISIAAVLMLGIGLSLRMQQEKPGIEVSAPLSEPAVPMQAAPEAQVQPAAPPPMPAAREAPASPSVLADQVRSRSDTPARTEKRTEKRAAQQASSAPPAADVEAAARAPQPRFAPAPQANITTPAASAPAASAPAPAPLVVPATPPQPMPQAAAPSLSKREALAASSDARAGMGAADSNDPVTLELERIARLRAAGRDADADKALEDFRRKNPDYRIAEAMWRRVKPR